MIRATVRCTRCAVDLLVVDAPSWPQLAHELATATLLCHAAQPHTSHNMDVVFEDGFAYWTDFSDVGIPGLYEELIVECLYEHCGHKQRLQAFGRVPLELVNAHVMVFHTAHEGHRMRVFYGPRAWESPAPQEPTPT